MKRKTYERCPTCGHMTIEKVVDYVPHCRVEGCSRHAAWAVTTRRQGSNDYGIGNFCDLHVLGAIKGQAAKDEDGLIREFDLVPIR